MISFFFARDRVFVLLLFINIKSRMFFKSTVVGDLIAYFPAVLIRGGGQSGIVV